MPKLYIHTGRSTVLLTVFALLASTTIALAKPVNITDLNAHVAEAPAIRNVVAQGIMRTIGPDTFKPDALTTRAELAASVQHMFNLRRPANLANFPDIPPNSPLYSSVEAVAPFLGRQTLCFGCALISNFLPNEPVSRIESAVLLTNVLIAQKKFSLLSEAESEPVLIGIEDAKTFRGPLRVYVATAIHNGVLPLTAPHRLDPTLHTRAQTAVLLNNLQERFNLQKVEPGD
jgi:hypothetical protein